MNESESSHDTPLGASRGHHKRSGRHSTRHPQTYPPSTETSAPEAMVGSQSTTCINPSYFVPHFSSGIWLVEYTKAGTYKKKRRQPGRYRNLNSFKTPQRTTGEELSESNHRSRRRTCSERSRRRDTSQWRCNWDNHWCRRRRKRTKKSNDLRKNTRENTKFRCDGKRLTTPDQPTANTSYHASAQLGSTAGTAWSP